MSSFRRINTFESPSSTGEEPNENFVENTSIEGENHNHLTIIIGATIPYGALSLIPLGIGALGQLLLLSSSKVAIQFIFDNPPIGGFKRIKSHSLSATLLSISNEGHSAFKTGRDGMEKICGYTENIRKAAMKAAEATDQNLSQASIDRIVSESVEYIKEEAAKCQEESGNMVAALEELLKLMEETSETCYSSITTEELQLGKNHMNEKEHQEKKKAAEMEKQQLETQRKEYEKRLKETQEELYSVLGSVPEGLTLLGLEALDIIRRLTRNSKSGALELSKVRMEIAKQANLEAERKVEKAREEMKAADREFNKALDQLSKLDLEQVSRKEAIEMLRQAVKIITCLLTHWRKLQEFCQSINTTIFLKLNDGSQKLEKDFLLQSALPQADRLLMSDDNLITQLKTIIKQAHLINCFGELYVKIFSLYIMPAIQSLSENSVVDPEKIGCVQNQLTLRANAARASIIRAIEEDNLLAKVNTNCQYIDDLFPVFKANEEPDLK